MKVLDLDIDYFMTKIATDIDESISERLPENEYGDSVWTEFKVRDFLEKNLGLSKKRKREGCIVKGHNEALFYWKKLIVQKKLTTPFEVVHIDSHADLGLGYSSWDYISNQLLMIPLEERFENRKYKLVSGEMRDIGIGDYLLFAIAFQWISKLTYCANPNGDKNDYIWETMKNFKEELIWDKPVLNTIQLMHNDQMQIPDFQALEEEKEKYLSTAIKEPEVPFKIIPSIKSVVYDGNFDFITVAQSPNYTPESIDFVLEIIKEYMDILE